MRGSMKERLITGSDTHGVFWAVADASLVEFIATLGWEFVIADLEHSAMSVADVEHCARACQAREIDLLVRLPLSAGSDMNRVLDAGATGIVVPYMESAADALEVVDLVKYPPLGRRGLAPMRGADFGMNENLAAYTARANRETVIVVQIESRKGVEALPEILKIDEIDVVFAGVLDLSMSLGVAGQTDHESVKKIVEDIARATQAAGKIFGGYGSDSTSFRNNRELGARLLAVALEDIIIQGSCGFQDCMSGQEKESPPR